MQIIYDNQLKSYLTPLAKCYILVGPEAFLIQESALQIRKAAALEGFHERLLFTLEQVQTFAWNSLITTLKTPSLFQTKQIIDWFWHQIPQEKNKSDIESLFPLYDNQILIIRAGYLTKAQMQSTWFQTIAQTAIVVNHWTPKAHALHFWIKERAQSKELILSQEIVQLLAEQYEGQLFALDQLFTKLRLEKSKTITLAHIQEHLALGEHPLGSLQSALLGQNPKKILEVLIYFKHTHLEMGLILWALHRLLQGLRIGHHKPNASHLLKSLGIFPKDAQSFWKLVRINSPSKLEDYLQTLADIDKLHKTGAQQESWQKICDLALQIGGMYFH
ncbi:MAG TPA: DNA polymerase III subunit delta [Gammaproteobacteria bacterium]|nr:DNA polymerase III subunit delta [Gammaproteobacteria bacterium]